MDFAKPCFDVGLATNTLDPMLDFWQQRVGLPFDHMLKVGRGQQQHRHDALGSVVKINHHRDPLPDTPPAGYREVLIARNGASGDSMADPDGNKVALVAPGTHGITQIAMRMVVRSLAAHRAFYTQAFGLEERPYERGAAFALGNGLILLEESPDAPSDADFQGKGWRYITFQVFDADAAHTHVLKHGGTEAMAPVTLGETARISMVRDPDGNWIELSQRASLVGALS